MTTPTISAPSWISHPGGAHPRLTHRGRSVALAATALTAVLVALTAWYGLTSPIAWSGGSASPAAWSSEAAGSDAAVLLAPQESRVHVVASGDTLWDLAVAIDPGADPRHTVDAIQRLNGLSGTELSIGRELMLPASGAAQR